MKQLISGRWNPDEGKTYQTVAVRGIPGITAKIYKSVSKKGYVSYVLTYPLLGKRKVEFHADPAKAKAAGEEAIKRTANNEVRVLELTNRDRDEHMRAKDILSPLGISLDVAATECVTVRGILNGRGSPEEAARFFVQQHAKELPRIDVPTAVERCLVQAKADGKSDARMHQLEHYLNNFAADNNCDVAMLTPGLISQYLTTMVAGERTKKNARDVIGYFGRWLVLHGYLARGTDLVEGVQKYSMKTGDIQIFTVEELNKLIASSAPALLPYIVIGAFAGLRGAEIQRLDWSEVDLADGFIEVKAEKAKTETRRLVPIKPNLAEWLKRCDKKSGPVCPYANVVNQLMKLVAKINKGLPKGTPEKERMHWKKNALRHSYISYRVADCADVARVADESGNSPAIIKANYLKRVKPAQAADWFAISPAQ